MAGIKVSKRVQALGSARLSARGWREAISNRVNGWGVITAERHRIALIKGPDLVFFAPAGADFDSPVAMTEAEREIALATALQWAKANDSALEAEQQAS